MTKEEHVASVADLMNGVLPLMQIDERLYFVEQIMGGCVALRSEIINMMMKTPEKYFTFQPETSG